MPESIIHNGFINLKSLNSLETEGLVNFDLATTKLYKGVKPMWKQLGFREVGFDLPQGLKYWQNIIPEDFNLLDNFIGINTNDVLIDNDSVGVTKGVKTPRTSYVELKIDPDQEWESNYYYPVLPIIDEFGMFTKSIDDPDLFGAKETWDGHDDSAPITNLNEVDANLILDIDFDQDTSDTLIDKTGVSDIDYNQDFEITLDENLRINIDTLLIPDPINKTQSEQAF